MKMFHATEMGVILIFLHYLFLHFDVLNKCFDDCTIWCVMFRKSFNICTIFLRLDHLTDHSVHRHTNSTYCFNIPNAKLEYWYTHLPYIVCQFSQCWVGTSIHSLSLLGQYSECLTTTRKISSLFAKEHEIRIGHYTFFIKKTWQVL